MAYPAHLAYISDTSAFEAVTSVLQEEVISKCNAQATALLQLRTASPTTVAGLLDTTHSHVTSALSVTAVCCPMPMKDARVKLCLIRLSGPALRHSLAATLWRWSQDGVKVNCGVLWKRTSLDAAISKGLHVSALTPESIALIHEDVKYQRADGFAEVALWEDLKKSLPLHLKLSTVAVVPQRDRRGWIILDLSFPVILASGRRGKKGHTPEEVMQEAVNATTAKKSPEAAVRDLENVLLRLLRFLQESPKEIPVLLSKLDLAGGFWRMKVPEMHRYNFAYVLPDLPGKPTCIVVPSTFQMGWAQLPAYICTAT